MPVDALSQINGLSVSGTPGTALDDVIVSGNADKYAFIALEVSGTFVATLQLQAGNTVATSDVPLEVCKLDGANKTLVTDITQPGLYVAAIPAKFYRLIVTAFTSGAADAIAYLSVEPIAVTAGQGDASESTLAQVRDRLNALVDTTAQTTDTLTTAAQTSTVVDVSQASRVNFDIDATGVTNSLVFNLQARRATGTWRNILSVTLTEDGGDHYYFDNYGVDEARVELESIDGGTPSLAVAPITSIF